MSPIIRRVVSAYGHADRSRHARADAQENADGRSGDDADVHAQRKRIVVTSFRPEAGSLASDFSASLDASARERKRKEARPKLSDDFEKRHTGVKSVLFFLESDKKYFI